MPHCTGKRATTPAASRSARKALREVRALGLEGTEEEIKLASTLVAAYWARGDLFSAQHLADQVIERAERLGSRTARGSAY